MTTDLHATARDTAAASPGELVDTSLRGAGLIALGAVLLLGAVFLYALVLHPGLGFGDLAAQPVRLTLLVSASCLAFMGFILDVGPSRLISVSLRPPMPFAGRDRTVAAVRQHNDPDYPFEVVETDRYDLLLHYKLEDARWRGRLFAGGLRQAYWLYVRLDEKSRTAWLVERTQGIRWDVGAGSGSPSARLSLSVFYGFIVGGVRREVILDPLAGFQKVADVGFHIGRARDSVMGLLLTHGWTLRYKLLPLQVRKPGRAR